MGSVGPRDQHHGAPPHADLRRRDRLPGRTPAVQHIRVPAERVLPVRQVPHRVPGDEGRGRCARRPEPRVQHVQEATRRRAAVDVPRVRRVQRRVPPRHPVQRLHPRGAREGPRPDGGGRRDPRVMETEYGPGRTIPHPVMFRVLDSEADDLTIPEIKVEHKSEFAYYPGCVDYYDVEMQFSHMNYGDTNHGIIFDSSVKLLRAVGIQPMILDRSFMKCCGHDQLWQGKVDVFERMREYNTKIIKMLGVKTFITSCAEGYRTFKLDYKLEGVRVVHITQFLYERLPGEWPTGSNIDQKRKEPPLPGRRG